MKTISKLLLAAALVAPAATVATSAQAQVNGVAVADPQGAIAGSRAWAAARQQIETTYKTQLDQAEARRTALTRELEPLVQAFQTARSQPNANQAALRTQAEQIESRQQAANQELQRLTQPAVRAQTYAVEQLQARLGEAVQNAVRAKNVSLLVSPQAVLFMQPTADITTAVTAELDKLVPTVSITPPANWQPGQGGQQAATPANAPAPAAAPAAAPARRQNSGR
ncbi:OmpH family outer membrane protein [Sphingomonas sp. NPDC019816]|uniref:OmpH family outer membrane protein n=1 Tax=unclassified Sphingomonas TaxID=196159 RepID=UPI00289836F1|nr:OmpH family outer membrane protein [Sphingomonas sp.]